MTTEEATKVAELLRDERFGHHHRARRDADQPADGHAGGRVRRRPVVLRLTQFPQVSHIAANPQVNVTTSGSSSGSR